MALHDFWKASPEAVLRLNVQQVISAAGNGNLRDGNECSTEFREFLKEISSEKLSECVRSCLEQSFKDSGLALQDLINEMGRRLGFDVEDGLYRGKPSAIGFDGIWRSDTGSEIIIEVKTTDYVTVSLDKIAAYKRKLLDANKVSSDASILIVVGREDTGALEAQIRGSRYAWDMRLIGADRLDSLLQIKEKSDDDNTVTQIQELLRPFEYTKVEKIIDVMFSAAQDIEPVEELDLGQVNTAAARQSEPEGGRRRFTQVRTDRDTLNWTRLGAVNGFGDKMAVNFHRHRQTLF